jgi:RNA polymerase sigma-70 factor (ECF subfamily)
VARLVGADTGAVEDVFQETMLAVARAGRNLDLERTTLWAWLAAIGHRQAAQHWRRHYRQPAATGARLPDSPADEDAADLLLRSETVDSVRWLLAAMPAADAALLMAKYLDELSVAEIVESLGGTVEGVRSKLARARRDFRARYERLDRQSLGRQPPAGRPGPAAARTDEQG